MEEKDRPAIRAVVRAAWREAYPHIFTAEEIEGVFAGRLSLSASHTNGRAGRVGTLVAKEGGEVIGFAWLGLLESGDGELISFYVHPAHRGRGVGLKLWERSLVELRERGCEEMQVWVLERAAALDFYRNRSCVVFAEGTFSVGEHTIGLRVAL